MTSTKNINEQYIYAIFKIISQTEKKFFEKLYKNLDIRIKLQKIIYIIQEILNYDLGLKFNLYIYGPYSPELAKLYYRDNLSQIIQKTDIPRNIKKIEKTIIELYKLDRRFLEILTTYHDLYIYLNDEEKARLGVQEIKFVNKKDLDKVILYYKKINDNINIK